MTVTKRQLFVILINLAEVKKIQKKKITNAMEIFNKRYDIDNFQ